MTDITATQQAYALLWRSPSSDPFVHSARKILRETLTLSERRAAVAWLLDNIGPMTTSELIAADIRSGEFPKRSA